MNHLNTRRLTQALALLAVISANHLHANETVQLAENGSERTLEQSRKQQQDNRIELAENGSARALEQSRKLHLNNRVELAENGSERTLQNSRRA